MAIDQPAYDAFFTNFRVDFDVEGFRALIDQKGYQAEWSQWVPCACAREESGQPNYVCPLCRGRGDRFINTNSCRALMTGLGAQKEFAQYSQWFVGGASLTVMADERFMGYRDKFVLVDSLSTHAEYRSRSTTSNIEYMQYAVVSVLALFCMNNSNDAYIDLVAGVDYTLNTNGTITWLKDVPYQGNKFSIVYNYHPTYQVMDIMNDARDTFVRDPQSGVDTFKRMPQRAMVRRSHLMFQSEKTTE